MRFYKFGIGVGVIAMAAVFFSVSPAAAAPPGVVHDEPCYLMAWEVCTEKRWYCSDPENSASCRWVCDRWEYYSKSGGSTYDECAVIRDAFLNEMAHNGNWVRRVECKLNPSNNSANACEPGPELGEGPF